MAESTQCDCGALEHSNMEVLFSATQDVIYWLCNFGYLNVDDVDTTVFQFFNIYIRV